MSMVQQKFEQRTAHYRQAGDQHTEVHNQNLGTGIQQQQVGPDPPNASELLNACHSIRRSRPRSLICTEIITGCPMDS